jgi:hypothetical protein
MATKSEPVKRSKPLERPKDLKGRRTALELYHVDLKDIKRSKTWFEERTKFLSTKKVLPNRLMVAEEGERLTYDLQAGKLYSYYYMPKGFKELPYYDTFPMVFPFDRDSKTFIGLNLHYLDYYYRFEVFRELMKTATSKYLTEDTKLQYNWDLIKNVSRLKPAKHCVKRYLFNHVQSPFLEFGPKDWPTALTLPVERFIGANKQQVWGDMKK